MEVITTSILVILFVGLVLWLFGGKDGGPPPPPTVPVA